VGLREGRDGRSFVWVWRVGFEVEDKGERGDAGAGRSVDRGGWVDRPEAITNRSNDKL
jgi:hypothetical protein